MRTIELAGPIGAGKSSAVAPLQAVLAARGLEAASLGTAMDRHGRPGRLGRFLEVARFAVQHGRLLVMAVRSLLRSPISTAHRLRILRIVLTLGGDLGFLERRMSPDAWVIIDEGWLHRTVNLFAWRDPSVSAAEIAAYLDLAPLSPIVVIVEVPHEVARRRLAGRGLPKRLRGRDPAEIDTFLARAASALDTAVANLRGNMRGVRLVGVPNDGDPEELASRMADAIDAVAGDFARRGPLPVFRQRWPGPPRPDRLLSRAAARRRSTRADMAWLPGALEGFELPAVGEARPPRSPGGRGTTVVAADGRGRRWLLKRYKTELSDDEIGIEHATLLRLAELDFPAPRLRRTSSGTTLWQSTGARIAAFALIEKARHPHEIVLVHGDRLRLTHDAGAVLAELHELLADFSPVGTSPNGFAHQGGPRTRPVSWHLQRLARALDQPDLPTPGLAAHADWIAQELERLERQLEEADPRRTVIHGDYGPYNLLVRRGRPPFVLDFELARIDWRLTDVATALGRFADRRTGWDAYLARVFLAGYRSRSDLSEAELALIPSVLEFLALRRAVVCLDRQATSGDIGWLEQAHRRLRVARRLASGDHPLHALPGT